MCLQAEVIDNGDGGIGRVRRSKGGSDNNRGVDRGRGICDASEGLETTAEAAEDRQRARGIYNDDGGVGGGRRAQK